MKYIININQEAALNSGLKLDFNDLAILDVINSFWEKAVVRQCSDGEFRWISTDLIMQELPLINFKKAWFRERISLFISKGILKKSQDCQQKSASLYAKGALFDTLLQTEQPLLQTEQQSINNINKQYQDTISGNINITPYNPPNSAEPLSAEPTEITSLSESENQKQENLFVTTKTDIINKTEIEKEKNSAKKEKEFFAESDEILPAVIQVNQPAEKTLQTEKNTANTQMLLTCPTANDKSTQITTRYDDIIAWFNNQVSDSGIRKIRCFNSDREAMIRRIVKQYGWEQVKRALQNATTSKFLTGKTDAEFVADFDFIFNKKKFPRILDGFYNKTDQSVKLVADIATNGVNTVMSACSLFDKDFFKKVNDNLKNGKPL